MQNSFKKMKIMNTFNTIWFLISIVVLLGTTSCSVFTPKIDPTQFYVLSPCPDTCCADANCCDTNAQAFSLGIGRIQIPNYLDSDKIAYIKCPNQVVYSDYHRWAGDLDANIQRVLGQNISYRIPCSAVSYSPWVRGSSRDIELHVQFEDFVADKSKRTLVAKVTWEITGKFHKNVYLQRTKCFEKQLALNFDYSTLLNLMNEELADISDAIAEDIQCVMIKYSKEIFCKQ